MCSPGHFKAQFHMLGAWQRGEAVRSRSWCIHPGFRSAFFCLPLKSNQRFKNIAVLLSSTTFLKLLKSIFFSSHLSRRNSRIDLLGQEANKVTSRTDLFPDRPHPMGPSSIANGSLAEFKSSRADIGAPERGTRRQLPQQTSPSTVVSKMPRFSICSSGHCMLLGICGFKGNHLAYTYFPR